MHHLTVFLVAVGLSAVKGAIDCTLEPEAGMCFAYFPSYFYNITTDECEKFVYGGCGGNSNRFPSKQECEAACQSSQEVDCSAEPDIGLCLARIPRYFYNADSRKCEKFVYGGCGGNTNNFRTLEECQSRCSVETPVLKTHDCVSKPETGLCEALFHRFYFNTETGHCERFVYGGCGGNGNNYNTYLDCRAACSLAGEDDPVPEVREIKEPDCTSPAVTGFCKAYMPSFFYNTASGECEPFVYGGCGGNGNRYWSKEDCISTCGARKQQVREETRPDCLSPAETGLCRGYFPSYFFNPAKGECEQFIYGGCGGNSNNYATKEECTASCGPRTQPIDCHSEPDVGLCKGNFPMIFFNRHTGTCESFIYGGCGGNDNRFHSLQECEDSCLM